MSDLHLPTALIVGPMKCATTWIHDYLEARGDVRLPHLVKETFYFDRYHHRGLAWYARQFTPSPHIEARQAIEVAPSLFHQSETVPHRIRSDLGDIPIVIVYRDPVARAWSHYQHMRRGYTQQSLSEAIQTYPEIVEASRYSVHVSRWQESFSEVTVLDQALLGQQADLFAEQLCQAIRLPFRSAAELQIERSNESTVPRSYLLAQIGRSASERLRHFGFFGLVDFAKRAGLKSLFYGSRSGHSDAFSADDQALLQRLLATDIGIGLDLQKRP